MKHLEKNSLGKNMSFNVIKQCCTIIFPFIAFTYSSHILGAENLGIWSFSHSIVSYFGLIVGLGFSTYAIREGAYIRDDVNKLKKFVNQIFSLNLFSLLLGYVLLFILLHGWSKLEVYRTCILIQSLGYLFTSIGIDWLNSIFEDYKYLTIRYIVIQLCGFILLVMFVRSKQDILQYTLITMLATYGGNILNIFYIRKKYFKYNFTFRVDLKNNMPPVFILFCSSAAVMIYTMSDTTMLGIFCDNTTVGIYSVAVKIYSLVKQFINAIVVVTVPKFSYLLMNGNKQIYNRLANEVVQIIMILVCPAIVGIFCEGENILYLFAGIEYIGGNSALRYLCFSLFFAVGGSYLANSILITNKKDKAFLFATIIAAFVNITLNFYMIPKLGMKGAAITTLIAELVNCLICLYNSKALVRFSVDYKNILSILIGSIVIGVLCTVINLFEVTRAFKLFLATSLSIVAYSFIMIIFKNTVIFKFLKKFMKTSIS